MSFSGWQIGCTALVASLAVCMLTCDEKKAFAASLTPQQAAAFSLVMRERLVAYLCGLAAGGLVGWAVVKLLCSDLSGSGKQQTLAVLAATGSATVAAYAAYKAYPKTAWMLSNINSGNQTALWLAMYRKMTYRYHIGFALAVCGYAILLRDSCCAAAPKLLPESLN